MRAMARSHPLLGYPWLPRWRFWLVVSIAVALWSIGGYLVGIDGQGTCHVPDATCPRVYNTKGSGLALVGLGVAWLLAIGSVSAIRRRRCEGPAHDLG
jgi:hypothetical protein